MYRIVRKEALRPTVTLYEIEAPLIAKKAQPGQFIILRVDENGERIPITINDYDPEKGGNDDDTPLSKQFVFGINLTF